MQYVRTAHGIRVHFLDAQRARTYCGHPAPLVVVARPDVANICLHCDRYRSVLQDVYRHETQWRAIMQAGIATTCSSSLDINNL